MCISVAPRFTRVFVCASREVHELAHSGHVTGENTTMQLYHEQIGIRGWIWP